MKIVATSDLHGILPEIPECDLFIIAGDIVPLQIQRNINKSIDWIRNEFREWSQSIPCKDKVFVWGNHDFVGQCSGDQRNLMYTSVINSDFVLLDDCGITLQGLSIYGSAYGEYPPGWAFLENRDRLKERFSHIPENLDILVTHCPPRLLWYDIVDSYRGMMHCGSEELAHEAEKKKPKYHFFGHIHEGDHEMKEIRGTNYCNVSYLDEHYKPVNPLFELEI